MTSSADNFRIFETESGCLCCVGRTDFVNILRYLVTQVPKVAAVDAGCVEKGGVGGWWVFACGLFWLRV